MMKLNRIEELVGKIVVSASLGCVLRVTECDNQSITGTSFFTDGPTGAEHLGIVNGGNTIEWIELLDEGSLILDEDEAREMFRPVLEAMGRSLQPAGG